MKLFATTLNAFGLAVAGLGFLGPLLGGVDRPGVQYLVCGVIFVGLHLFAQWVLHLLED